MELTETDVKSIIRDEVRAGLAEKIIEGGEKANEDLKRRQLDGDLKGVDVSTIVARAVEQEMRNGGYAFPRAVGDRERGIVAHDPHGGRGLDAMRCLLVHAESKLNRVTPVEAAKRRAESDADFARVARAMSEGSFASGGALIPAPAMGEFIEMLYAATVTGALGVRHIDINRSLDLGKQTGSATAYMVGEAANITPSTPATGTISLKAKKQAALVAVSNEMMRNPSAGALAFVRDDLIRVMALKQDLNILRGSGTEFTPKGIKNWIASANSNAQSGTALANKVADLVKAIRLVDESDIGLTAAGFAMHPRVKWDLMATLDSNGNHVFLAWLMSNQLYGFPVKTTSQIPKNLGGGTNESEVYFGQWSDCIVGDDPNQTELEAFMNGTFYDGSAVVSGISTDQSVVRALSGYDVAVRHNTSFSMVTGVTWGG